MPQPRPASSQKANASRTGRRARARNIRLQAIVALFFLGSGAAVLTFREHLTVVFNISRAVTLGVGIVLLGNGLAGLMLLYLRGAVQFRLLDSVLTLDVDPDVPSRLKRVSDADLESLRSELLTLNERVAAAAVPGAGVTEADRETLIDKLRETISPALAKELEQRFGAEFKRSEHLSQTREVFDANARRLETEIASLSRRGNLNLVIGVLATISAAVLLYWIVLRGVPSLASMHEVLSYYIPRLATVIFVEVFAFFFPAPLQVESSASSVLPR